MEIENDVVRAARGWIGTPYLHQASVKGAGCDCLGLLRGVWRELRGHEPEVLPPYSEDWAEVTGDEVLRDALARYLTPMPLSKIAPGQIVLFRMHPRGPAKHCGIVAQKEFPASYPPLQSGGSIWPLSNQWRAAIDGPPQAVEGASVALVSAPLVGFADTPPATQGENLFESRSATGKKKNEAKLTLIHARQNKRVSEEPFSPFWRKKLAFVFRICGRVI